MKPTDLSYHLTRYLSVYLPGIRGLSRHTIASRRDAFALLLGYCRDVRAIPVEKVTLQHLTRKLITDFLDWLEQERGCCAATRNQRLTSLKSFFTYLQSEAPEHLFLCQQILAVPLKKTPGGSIGYLTLDGMKAVFDAIDVSSRNGRRDLVLLSVLYDSGARVQELADVTVGDIRLAKPATIKLAGKGGKTRIVPLMEPTAGLLRQYVREHNLDGPQHKQYPLFCNRTHTKLSRAGIAYVLKKYVERSREVHPTLIGDTVSVHSIRHYGESSKMVSDCA